MRIGMLTGGGDCPGLNAVIRAVVRKGIDAHGDQLVGFRDGWRGVLDDVADELTIESTRGILPRGGTILGSSRTNPRKREDGTALVRATLAAPRTRRPDRDRRRGHARRRPSALPGGRQRDRRAQDDRQRPRGDRPDLRLRHRAADRHRRDRPAAHHRREPPPHPGGRGDGPQRRLDRPALGAGRRCRRDPDPRDPLRHRRGLRPDPPPPRSRAATSRSSSSPRARCPRRGR